MSNPLFFQFHNHPSSGVGFQTNFNSGDLEVHTAEKNSALQVKLSDSHLSVSVSPPTAPHTLKGIFKPRNLPLLLSTPSRHRKPKRHESSSSSIHYTNEVAPISDTSAARRYPGGFKYHDRRERRGVGSVGTSRVLASHPEDVYRLGMYEGRDLWNLLGQRVQDPGSVSTSTSDDERVGGMIEYDPRRHYNDARIRPPGAERGYDSYERYRDPRNRVFR